MINFDTAILSLRYGISDRINLSATLPWHSIASDKFQGDFYSRLNRGFGDLLLTAEWSMTSSPQLALLVGVELPSGSVDKTDELGQRIDDILSLGSGTTDLVIGGSAWVPHVAGRIDVIANVRHRFSGGQNKWGYRYGDLTDGLLHASYPVNAVRLGVRLEGFHTEPDTWYGNVVPERGASILYAGPTLSWSVTPGVTVGGFARFPVVMELEGSQMMGDGIVGLELSTDLTPALDRIRD